MTDNLKFGQYLPRPFRNFNERDIVWLWQHLKTKHGYEPSLNYAADIDGLTADMGRYLRKDRGSLFNYAIIEAKMVSMVKDDDLRFIDKRNSRFVSWLIYSLKSKFGFDFSDAVASSFLDDWSLFLAILDCSNKPLGNKKADLRECIEGWSNYALPDRIFDWFDEKDDEQSSWLLAHAAGSSLPKYIAGRLNYPTNTKQEFLKFKCLLDQSDWDQEIKKLYLNDLKRKWRARGRVKSKGKVQSNVLVAESTKEGIEKLREEYGLKTRGEVIDRLVSKALREKIDIG
ncbi:MAG: hypothetical protein ABJM11_04260 [Marinobacter sp.]|uniref:hypothetical protein n=1 Tax=Marinobacter sp. TaxID=50741 RepID=UPI003298A4C3